jgi:phosphatidylserine decarboxylase
MTPNKLLRVLPQYLLTQHELSRLLARLTHCQQRTWKNSFIRAIIKLYGVNMDEAVSQQLDDYPSFNAFFTRALKPNARIISDLADAIVSPADGVINQIGAIANDQLLQAKGHHYSLIDLLGGDTARARQFQNGQFATVYLSPKDYHRLHMPLSGQLTEMVHIPGRLFSVNATTADTVPRLFARNERVVCYFDTAAGPMALILVGAIFVSSIETVWHGVVTPPTLSKPRHWHYTPATTTLEKGMEMGRFNMGSTIIVLFGAEHTQWKANLQAGSPLQVGQCIGHYSA